MGMGMGNGGNTPSPDSIGVLVSRHWPTGQVGPAQDSYNLHVDPIRGHGAASSPQFKVSMVAHALFPSPFRPPNPARVSHGCALLVSPPSAEVPLSWLASSE